MAGVRAVDPRVSFAELQQWPDDGRRYELYRRRGDCGSFTAAQASAGRAAHCRNPPAEYEHAAGGLLFGSPLDIVFSEHNVLQPDVTFFRAERRHVVDMMEPTRFPPDLAVEVLSRSTEARDRGRKMALYARFGVLEYWIVDPVSNELEIYRLEGNGYRLDAVCGAEDSASSPTLHGLTIAGARVFAP